MLARSKLNCTESKISDALISNETSHECFITTINEEKKYRELKESIRMVNSGQLLWVQSSNLTRWLIFQHVKIVKFRNFKSVTIKKIADGYFTINRIKMPFFRTQLGLS